MLLTKTYIAASRIEGVGVFAAEPVRRGDPVWRSDPTFDMLVAVATYRSAPPQLKQLLERYAYPSHDQPGFLVYETDNGRFMNHSATPNTDFSGFGVGTAIVDIAAHEELTCDYRQFYIGFEDMPENEPEQRPPAALSARRGQAFPLAHPPV